MRNIRLIARREYLEQIHGRAFMVSTILLPLLFAVMAAVGFLDGHKTATGTHLAIAAGDAALAGEVRRQLLEDKDADFTVDVVAPATGQDRAAMMKLLQSQAIDGYLWIDTSSPAAPVATYTSRSSSGSATIMQLNQALNRGLIDQRLTAKGMKQSEADAMIKVLPIQTRQVNKKGQATKGGNYASLNKGMIMAFLLTMTTMLYGLDTARSIIEEKSSRIFEVMLAIVKPDDLLAGKLVGVGAVGLTQIGIWVGAAALLAISALAAPLLTGGFALHFSWLEAALFPLYFVLGFFLYSSLFSGLAATCETAQELQMYMPLAAAPVWLSFGIIPLLFNDPNSALAIAASIFPLTAPFVMMLRMGLAMPPAWQFAASLGAMVLGVWAALWFSTRLYRVGVLMYGKRATVSEIVRWLRYS
jgi:ABC-2 type transport system permease protein